MSRTDEKPWTKEQIDRMYDDAALALRAGDSQAEYHLEAYEVCDLIAGFRAEVTALQAKLDQARKALERLLQEPHGCSFCDSGVLRKRVDGQPAFHRDTCPYHIAAALLASNPEGT